jgi:hypothetical protein
MRRARLLALAVLVAASDEATAQGTARRLATVSALHQYPGYYHLQNVLLHGEFVENGSQIVLRGGERDVPVIWNDQRATTGLVEVRGVLLDVGRLEQGDPRLTGYDAARDQERWPRPGEELVLSVTAVSETQLATTPSVRALALQPWRFDGQKVSVVGQFRGRNLYADLPSAPGKSRYDFVLRSADGAVWVTDLRPRGKGFDLSVDARVDTGRWLQVSGLVSTDRGLVTIAGATVAVAEAPAAAPPVEEEIRPEVPVEPAEVVFSSPTEGDIGVSPSAPVRIQFSRGLDPASLADRVRVTYIGATQPGGMPAAIQFQQTYDAGPRAIEVTFVQPLDPFRTVRVELLEGLRAFDGAPVAPWALTFSTGN